MAHTGAGALTFGLKRRQHSVKDVPQWVTSVKAKEAFQVLTSYGSHLSQQRFMLFLRPLLTNTLLLSDAYALFANAAMRSRKPAHAARVVASGIECTFCSPVGSRHDVVALDRAEQLQHADALTCARASASRFVVCAAATMQVEFPAFLNILTRIAHIKYGGGNQGSLARLLAEVCVSLPCVSSHSDDT